MEFKELKKKSVNELHRLLHETRDKLRDLRFKDANKQLKNVREIRDHRQTVARVLTLLNKKEETAPAAGQPADTAVEPTVKS